MLARQAQGLQLWVPRTPVGQPGMALGEGQDRRVPGTDQPALYPEQQAPGSITDPVPKVKVEMSW